MELSQLLQSLNFVSTFEIHFEKAPSNLSDHDSFGVKFWGKWIRIEDAWVHEGRKGEVEFSVKLTEPCHAG